MLVSRKCLVERPLIELLEELRMKFTLLEGDRTAYYENSFLTMQTNREKISSLRKEVHSLRLAYWEKVHKDDAIISQAFQNRPVEKSNFLHKSSEDATEECDFRVSASMKRFNMSKFLTEQKQEKLQKLQVELKDAQKDLSCDLAEKAMKTHQLQKIRDLENRVDKIELKGTECQFLHKTYEAIFRRLYEEHVGCNRSLDDMEADIMRCRAEKAELEAMHREADTAKEQIERELRQHEQFEAADRKRRDIESARMRRVVDEEKLLNERVEKKTIGEETFAENTVTEITDTDMTGEEMKAQPDPMDALEDSMEKLQEVTGLSNLKTIVKKFEDQLDIKEKLVSIINHMEKSIQCLRQDCNEKREQLSLLRSKIDNRSTEVTLMMSTKNKKVSDVVKDNSVVSEKFDHISSYLVLAKSGLEHLMEKLLHVKLPEKPIACKPSTPEEYMTELFERIQHKTRILLAELKPYNVEDYMKKMQTEADIVLVLQDEVEAQLVGKVPNYNNRVEVPEDEEPREDLDSGPDNPLFKNRQVMKHDSALFIEMRLKKRHRKKRHRR